MKYSGRILLLVLLITTIPIIALRCSRNLAGATTETTNGIMGTIYNNDNTPAPNTVVKLFPNDYDPVTDSIPGRSFIDTTDARGNYVFQGMPSGRYVALARNRNAATCLLVKDILVKSDSVTTVPMEILKKSGAIAVNFLPGSIAAGQYVYIPGTDIYYSIINDKPLILDNIPQGTFTELILSSDKHNILRNAITVLADDTTSVNLPLWKFSRSLTLNTTSAGADVSGDVYKFPVLIRLNSSNFDFSQARTDGGDLVFTDKNSKILPHQIERWDATSRKAEIWVKVDTIHGNDSTQSLVMYWGKSSSLPQQANNVVFDTAEGYQGVWHLGDTNNNLVYDATVNKYDGSSPDSARAAAGEGVIGKCKVFNGVSDYISMPNTANSKLNFAEKGNYTVSAWVLIDTLDGKSHCIISKGYEQYYLRSTYISKNILTTSPLWEFVEFSETDKWQTSTAPASGSQWALLVGVRNGDKQLLYCNGTLVDSTIDLWVNTVSRNTSNDLSIGRFANEVTVPIYEGYCYFKGSIDEVRIINKAVNTNWVRLCYMNQRPDNRLVMFR